MAQRFLTSIDLTKNQLLNVALQNLATAPSSPVTGQIYYNTTDSKVYLYNGSAWVDISGDITGITTATGSALTGGGTSGNLTLAVSVDNVTLEITGNSINVKDLGITTAKLAAGAVTDAKITTNTIALNKITQIGSLKVLGNLSGATANVSEVSVITDTTLSTATNTNLPTSSAVKGYVDAAIAGLGNLEGGWNASSGTFPVAAGGTKKGDYWYVTTAGTTGGVTFSVGDVIIAKVDNASTTLASDWIQLETNQNLATTTTPGIIQLATDAEVQTGTDSQKAVVPSSLSARTATETRTGIAEIATQAETDAGTDDTRIVTPLKLTTFINNRTGGYATNVGNAAATSFTVTHNLNTRDVTVAIYDNTTYDLVYADVAVTTVNTITVVFATAPALNAYRVVVKK
jgi:hypothetical protein